MKFSELDLHPSLRVGIERLNYSECTPVQEQTMPPILEGRDVSGLAQTGTGKTAAFLLPLMERIVRSRLNPEQLSEEERAIREKRMFPDWRANQFILVLVPTRELAEQVFESAIKLKGDSELRAVSIYGGVAYDKQKQGLRDGVEFVVATPGRLIDLFKENLLDLKQCRAIVFDEADRMFDMGFKDDMKFILQRVPKERQFLVFSATLNLDVLNTAYQFGANPHEVNVSRDQAKAENVVDKIFHVGQDEKGSHLLSLLRLHKPRQAIIFSNFKMNVPRISQFLNDNRIPTVGISSLLTQSQRTRVMEQFKGEGDYNVLVATDVAARGLDIKGVDMVVNFELPDDPENYVHRIGRTGRAGAKGIAFSLVSDRDVDALSRVEQYLKHKVDTGYLEESELVKDYKAMPSERGARSERGPRPQPSGEKGIGGRRSSEGRASEGRSSRPGGRRERGEGRGERDQTANGRPPAKAAKEGQPREGRGESSRRDRGPRVNGPGRDAKLADQQPRETAKEAGKGTGAPSAQSRPPGREGGRKQGPGRERNASRGQARPGAQAGAVRTPSGRPRTEGPTARGSTPKQGASGAKQPTLGKKVSGFFKRLFGG